jgi:multiple sugar transport system permease protein
VTTLHEVAAGRDLAGRPPRGRRVKTQAPAALFVVPYAVLLLIFGAAPSCYALYLAFTKSGQGFVGISNFSHVIDDFRFGPAVWHVSLYLLSWIVALVVLVVVLAIMVHSVGVRWLNGSLRFLYYLPGALAGASAVLLWLFVLDPSAGPAGPLLRAFGYHTFSQTIHPTHLPYIFAIISFWTGAGGWILVMFGALNNISTDVIEAARIDGASRLQIAWRIQLPSLRKWIAYMVVLSLAAGTQLFVEPTLLSQASQSIVPNDYSINQLAYQYAFNLNDFNGSAAIAVLLLVVALALSALFVWRGGLFTTEER